MANLENLIQKIVLDAQKEAEMILDDAKRKKEAIVQKKRSEAEKIGEQFIRRAEREGNMEKDRLISRAKIEERDRRLIVKRDMIERTFALAKEKLIKLDDRAYVQFLQTHLKDVSLTAKEVLIVPDDKRDTVKNLRLPVTVSEEQSVESGFLLKGEHFMMNHTIDSLLNYERDELELEVAKILFGDEGA